VGFESPWSGQHRGRANRRAVAKANGRTVEITPHVKLIQVERLEMPRVSFIYSMANAGAEVWGSARIGLPAEVEGGNPGKPSSESSEGLVTGQEDP